MTLKEIIDHLEHLDNSLTICAARSPDWTGDSEAELRPAIEVPGGRGFPYFLEVSVAKNVLQAWSYARDGRVPGMSETVRAIIYYAENDAYLLPEA